MTRPEIRPLEDEYPKMFHSMTRRSALGRPLLAAVPAPARAAIEVLDAAGRRISLPQPAERNVVGFYADELAAIAGTSGWQRVAGLSKRM